MAEIPELLKDLALILALAGIVSIVFKRLKQPLVLGYVMAGFLASPNMPYTPIKDLHDIHTWAEIGVIILLFTLGLEFSFKKIVRMGGAPIIAACTIIFCMIFLGAFVGNLFGWSRMDCIYLGGMLAMSSTTIIYKAFQDLGVLQKRFAGLVMSVLILEDVLAIVLMVMLSTLAVRNNIEGGEMLGGLLRLCFFLVVWFIVGIYAIPLFLRKNRKWMNNETLLIVSLALCLGMAVLAVYSGFSAAFGAFVVGSILAETVEAEHIGRLVAPVKDLFGAIFFVSVGMLVEPQVLVDYALPIAAITLTIILGQAIFGSLGFVLAGQPLKEAMKCGFSMSQIGELAFIIASLGVSLQVTSHFLYPIVVAVSVITTFTTPYMLKISEPAYGVLSRLMPKRWTTTLERYTPGNLTMNQESNWRIFLAAIGKQIVVYSVLSIAVIALSFTYLLPFLRSALPHWWANGVCGAITLIGIAPFLRAIVVRKNHSREFTQLWRDSRYNRLPLISTILLRAILAAGFVFYIIRYLVPFADVWLLCLTIVVVIGMVLSKRLKLHSIRMEKAFIQNLRRREMRDEMLGEQKPGYARRLMSRDLHLADFELPTDSLWAGASLSELNLGYKYGVHVASILRGNHRFNIPKGEDKLFPGDKIQVIGTDEQLTLFSTHLEQAVRPWDDDFENKEMKLKQLVIDEHSVFLGKSIENSGIRSKYHCMVVGFEVDEEALEKPDINRVFCLGDVIWVVGEDKALHALL